ncbi:hypothetical protein Pmar_PMAR019013 [Perkinsus marinus ATCC 50983]|uniref:Rab-GAP TBC domain-containing protein n=2 Tax=Perkinsus marinus (strain ATCC 50983 / TXsc) TaxID=423536 RepID=C5KY28_PERM5|nr:hypothetical protein Pmar_PMAR019013 [Perkinsus marinus ATCC 50983]EER10635.1 hypothetical protein Pmar_PMAR019013 [Perkinsus marinus ATCC 50983]|eukprot:XP_002778840.1 hypothetical protein Pmar_PMAR019013 [Perkinsus marinus ATCC 50983]
MVRKRSDDSEDEDQLCVEEAAHKWGEAVDCQACPVDEPEVMTFRSAVSLLVRYQMVRMFELSDRFRLSLWTFDRLLEASLPRVYALLRAAFDGLGVPTSFYASSWFLTLFASDLRDEEEASERILDMFLSRGWKAIHRIGLVMMEAAFVGDDFSQLESTDGNDLLMLKLKCLPGIVISELTVEEVLRRSEDSYGWVSTRLLGMLENAAQVEGGARLVLSRTQGFEVPLSGTPESGGTSSNYCSRGRSESVTGQSHTGWAIVADALPEHQFKLDPDDDFDRDIFDSVGSKKSSGRWSFKKRISTRKAKKILGKLSRSRSGKSPRGTYHVVRSEMLHEEDNGDDSSPERLRRASRVLPVDSSPSHDFANESVDQLRNSDKKKKHSWKKNPFKKKNSANHT